MARRSPLLAIVVAVILACGTYGLRAQTPGSPVPKGEAPPTQEKPAQYPGLSEQELNERFLFIRESFDGDLKHARHWYWSFLGAYTLFTLQGVYAATAVHLPESRPFLPAAVLTLNADPRLAAALAAREAYTVRVTDDQTAAAGAVYGTQGYALLSLMQSAFEKGERFRHARQDGIVNGWSSALGVAALALAPFPAATASEELSRMPSGTADERRLRLARGESNLIESAETEAFGRGTVAHALTAGVALLAGAALRVGYGRSMKDAGFAFLGNLLVGELQIWTQPTRSISDLPAYRKRFPNADPKSSLGRLEFRGIALVAAHPRAPGARRDMSMLLPAGAALHFAF